MVSINQSCADNQDVRERGRRVLLRSRHEPLPQRASVGVLDVATNDNRLSQRLGVDWAEAVGVIVIQPVDVYGASCGFILVHGRCSCFASPRNRSDWTVNMLSDEEAKTAQQALSMVDHLGQFVSKVVGGPLLQASRIVEDGLRYKRWERQVRLMQRAEKMLSALDIQDTRPVPLKVALPLFQAATLEEDDDMQDRWARLLVNAMDPECRVDVQRRLVSILEDFGPLEALLLDRIVDAPPDTVIEGLVNTSSLPDRYTGRIYRAEDGPLVENIEIALWNLTRLGCISPGTTFSSTTVAMVTPTLLGRALVEACRLRGQAEA